MADVRRDTPGSPHFECGHYPGIMAALLQRSNERGAGYSSWRVPGQTECAAGFVRSDARGATRSAPQLVAMDLPPSRLPGVLARFLLVRPGSAQVAGTARTLSRAARARTDAAGPSPMQHGSSILRPSQSARFRAVQIAGLGARANAKPLRTKALASSP